MTKWRTWYWTTFTGMPGDRECVWTGPLQLGVVFAWFVLMVIDLSLHLCRDHSLRNRSLLGVARWCELLLSGVSQLFTAHLQVVPVRSQCHRILSATLRHSATKSRTLYLRLRLICR